MSIAPKLPHTKRKHQLLFVSGLTVSLFGISIGIIFGTSLLHPRHAAAALVTGSGLPTAPVPPEVKNTIAVDCAAPNNFNIVQVEYLSPVNNSSGDTVNVPFNSGSVNLWLNVIVFRCQNNTSTAGSSFITNISPRPSAGITFPEIIDIAYPPNQNPDSNGNTNLGDWRLTTDVNTVTIPGPFTRDTTFNATVTEQGTIGYDNGAGGTIWRCAIGPGQIQNTVSGPHDFAICPVFQEPISIIVHVTAIPPDIGPPTITCTATFARETFTVTDPGGLGGPITVTVKDASGNNVPTTRSGLTYTSDLANWRGYASKTFTIRASDPLGGTATPRNFTLPACVNPSCSVSLSINGPGTKPILTVRVNDPNFGLTFGTLPSTGLGDTIRLTLTGPGYSQSIASLAYTATRTSPTLIVANWTAPTINSTGAFSSGGSFTAAGRTVNCNAGSGTSLDKPYFRVYGGDVSAGSGFAFKDPSNLNCTTNAQSADIVGWNLRKSPSYQGAGSQLAGQAINDIVGFSTEQGINNGDGLSFSNVNQLGFPQFANPTGDLFGGHFTVAQPNTPIPMPEGVPCIHDYFADKPASAQNSIKTLTCSNAGLQDVAPGNPKIATFPYGVNGQTVGDIGRWIQANNKGGTVHDFYLDVSATDPLKSDNTEAQLPGCGSQQFPGRYNNGLWISNSEILEDEQVTVYVKGNVLIDAGARANVVLYRDAATPGAWSVGHTPLFRLVVEGNIYIDTFVDQLDGVYVAEPDPVTHLGGTIYDCTQDQFAPDLVNGPNGVTEFDSADCGENSLVLNGALIANELHLMRNIETEGHSITDATGAGQCIEGRSPGTCATSKAAEVFNYVPEVWFYNLAKPENGTYDSIISLPPIF